MRILLVEDEAPLREMLAARLHRDGYTVDSVEDGEKALLLIDKQRMDIAIIDLGLPGMSGMQLIEHIRRQKLRYPILVLTARSSWQDKVAALKHGADDYMVKPFHAEELLARIQVLIRRVNGWAESTLRYGKLELDTAERMVRVDGNVLALTEYEYKTLDYLMLNANKLITREELGKHVYTDGQDPLSNVLDVFIGRLRRKLAAHGIDNPIKTVRGRGYRFVIADDHA